MARESSYPTKLIQPIVRWHTRIIGIILRMARNETGERSGVSPPVPRSCTGKLTHAARQCLNPDRVALISTGIFCLLARQF